MIKTTTIIFIIFGVIGGMAGLLVLSMALNIITIPWLKLGRQVSTERGIIERTYNPDNALYNYHWFKERFEAIKATEYKIKIAKEQVIVFEASVGSRKDWTFEDKTENARLNSVYHGLKSHYEDLVAEYNARAKQVDRAIFQNNLPTFFSLEPF